jgi:hypothetical protein
MLGEREEKMEKIVEGEAWVVEESAGLLPFFWRVWIVP